MQRIKQNKKKEIFKNIDKDVCHACRNTGFVGNCDIRNICENCDSWYKIK